MNGAQALIRTLIAAGVDTCFMNPGTSEMHFVAALDDVPEMRGVLALFEGVATGAADGYSRMAGHPAAVLLHLGPGLGNGLANLHNARRGHVGVVNIVGDHATYHAVFDAPLQSDIAGIAASLEGWVRMCSDPASVAADAAAAVAAATGPPGRVATLILPADTSWLPSGGLAEIQVPAVPAPVDHNVVDEIAGVLAGGERAALMVGGSACMAEPLLDAGRICERTGALLLAETFPPACSAERAAWNHSDSATWQSSHRRNSTASSISCWWKPPHRCRSSPTRTRPPTLYRTVARSTC